MKTKDISLYIIIFFLFPLGFQAQTWIKHTAQEAKFKVNFPNKTQVQKDEKLYMASAKYKDTGYKVVALLKRDFGSDYNKLLDDNINGFITKSDKVEKRSKLFKVNGYPAKEIYISSASSTCMFYRVIVTPNNLYQILVTKKGSYENPTTLKTFLDSFEIIR